jgi:FkbM family methyltransferase
LFNLDPEDFIDKRVLKNGYYEEEVLEGLLQYIGNDGVLWDIGANIGIHSITVKHLRPDAKVVCFEHSPFTFSRLYLNANLSGTDLLLFNIALGASSGYPHLNLMISGNSGLTSLRPWEDVSYQHLMHCFCDTAANLVTCGVVPFPTVVKIDVEGFEFEVISGFRELLDNRELRAIIFESPTDFIENSNRFPSFQLLRQAGFDITPLSLINGDGKILPRNFLAKR